MTFATVTLTHWGRVTHICVGKLTIIGSDNGLSPGRRQAISRTMQCWDIVNWNLRNKLQWNLKRNSYIFIQENAFENVVWKMAAILSRPQCVNEQILTNVSFTRKQSIVETEREFLKGAIYIHYRAHEVFRIALFAANTGLFIIMPL